MSGNILTFILLSDLVITLAFLAMAFRFWQVFRKIPEKISKFFFYFALFLAISFFLIVLCVIFDSAVLLILALFLMLFSWSSLGYLIFYLKFPRLPARYGFLLVFILGIITLLLTLFFPMVRHLEPTSGKVVFALHPVIGGLYFFIIIITALPMGIIFIQKGLSLPPSPEKTKVYGLGIILFLGIITAFFYSLSSVYLPHSPYFFFLTIVWAIIIFGVTFFTQKPPPSYVKKI